jgi:hypothetical protein
MSLIKQEYLICCAFLIIRSPGEILSIKVSAFETLSQAGVANVTTKNTGKLEASYSLTVCI